MYEDLFTFPQEHGARMLSAKLNYDIDDLMVGWTHRPRNVDLSIRCSEQKISFISCQSTSTFNVLHCHKMNYTDFQSILEKKLPFSLLMSIDLGCKYKSLQTRNCCTRHQTEHRLGSYENDFSNITFDRTELLSQTHVPKSRPMILPLRASLYDD